MNIKKRSSAGKEGKWRTRSLLTCRVSIRTSKLQAASVEEETPRFQFGSRHQSPACAEELSQVPAQKKKNKKKKKGKRKDIVRMKYDVNQPIGMSNVSIQNKTFGIEVGSYN